MTRRADAYSVAVAALFGLLAVVALSNALDYPAIAGYDAAEHIAYARRLISDFEVPRGQGAYYTPPGFYLLAGAAATLGDHLGLEWEQGGQILTAALTVATGVLVLLLARLVFPQRRFLQVAALAFYACVPLVYKVGAMFHPQVLVVFLSTLAVYLGARTIAAGAFRVRDALAVGLTLGLALLVRNVAFATLGALVVTLCVVAVRDPSARWRALRTAVVAGAVAAVVAAPWYLHLRTTYDDTLFGRPASVAPRGERWRPGFYLQVGLPDVITAARRPEFTPTFTGVLYADTWGDYFGVWPPHVKGSTGNSRARLAVQSIAGILPTTLAFAGWMALIGTGLGRRPGAANRLLLALVPLSVTLAILAYATRNPSADGDTSKGLFLLPAIPLLAVASGVALDAIRVNAPRAALAVAVLLVAAAAVSVWFGVA